MMAASLGFGVSGPLGARWFSERKLARLVAQAIDGGIRHFDTAPFYGEAEERLARALRAVGARNVIVSTKTGTRRKGGRITKDFSPGGMRADIEGSCRRFARDRLDLVYLHGPSADETGPALDALRAVKEEGLVKAIGVCGKGAALGAALESGADAIMGVFNVADRRHEALFLRAQRAGVQTVAIAPLAQGALTGAAPSFGPSGLWRLARDRVRAPAPAPDGLAEALGSIDGYSRAGAALAFVLQSGAVDVAFTTTTNPRHLAGSLDAATRSLPAASRARLGLDPEAPQS